MIGAPVTNIARPLTDLAHAQPDASAVVHPSGAELTFRELDERSDHVARGLLALGLEPGDRVVLMVPPELEFFVLTFALFKAGIVPVLVDPGMGIKNLGACLREAQPHGFIGIPKAHIARKLFGWGRTTLRTLVTVGPRLLWGGTTLAQVERWGKKSARSGPIVTAADDTAAILFTSGSTGVPKGAVYTHGIFMGQVEHLKNVFGISPGEIDLPTFPLFALFGPALGMTAILPEMDPTRPAHVDPQKICDAIRKHGCTNMFGSPALLDRVGRWGQQQQVKLPTLRRVLSAGAPVAPGILRRFTSLLDDGVEVFTPYGATEALPVAVIGSNEVLAETAARTDQGAGICVGHPVPGIDVRIIRITDEPIAHWGEHLRVAPGEVGEIVVGGNIVTQRYFNRPQSTALSKIRNGPGPVLHRMGDLGLFDEQGRLWFCGRKSHRVQASDQTLFTIPCEGVFNAHPDVRRSALVQVEVGGHQKPLLCVEREKQPTMSTDELSEELLQLGKAHDHTQRIEHLLYHDDFPVDIRHNAKIFREKLAHWAQRKMS